MSAPKRKAVLAFWQRAARYEADNMEAARIISRNPLRYPGLMQTWAGMVLAHEQYELEGAA